MLTGITSITFRELNPAEIVRLVKDAGLDGIEWGADIHCPPGNLQNARDVARLTEESGLKSISYGTYYNTGNPKDNNFEDIVETAAVLGAGNIRIWTGDIHSKDASEEYRNSSVREIKRVAALAAARGITVSFEYHHTTLTDFIEPTVRLLNDVNMDNVFTYWQPQAYSVVEENVKDIELLVQMKKLKNLHVFSWEGFEKLPLVAHADRWQKYVAAAAPCEPALLLEFVKEPGQFSEDALQLKKFANSPPGRGGA